MAGILTAAVTACSDDQIELPGQNVGEYDSDTQLVLKIALPSNAAAASRATTNPDTDECKVNSLKFIAFTETGAMESRGLPVTDVPVADDRTAEYQIKGLQPGNYKVYILANIPDQLLGAVDSEAKLRQVLLDYTSKMPQIGNLPMVYEPSGAIAVGEAVKNPAAVHTFSLQYACVKVRYNIIFDNSDPDAAKVFGANRLAISEVIASNVSKDSRLIADAAYLSGTRSCQLVGQYFSQFVESAQNASSSNADVLVASNQLSAANAAKADKWVWQGTTYLPERYPTKAAEQTTLQIKADVLDPQGNKGTVHCQYNLPLGGYDGDQSNIILPRNTYYEVIAQVKSLGTARLDSKIIARDWMQTLIDVNLTSTYLTLSKNKAAVNSLEDDEITYATDGRGGIEVVCENKLPVSAANGKPALIFIDDQANHKITVRVNPEVDIISLPRNERTGTANCYIKVGNIKKYFRVEYDIAPFFTIEPADVKISYSRSNSQLNTKVYNYRTNLGGLLITTDNNINSALINASKKSSTVTLASKRLALTCSDPSAAVGTLTVTALDEPTTTLVHYFDAYPLNYSRLSAEDRQSMSNQGKEDLSVTVMPPLGGYRIYFRAINDYHARKAEGSAETSEFLVNESGTRITFPTEGSSNWIDFWDNMGANSPNTDAHRLYVYTQFGETVGTTIDGPVWKFTADYGSGADQMTADNANTGWYYYDLEADRQPRSKENMNKATAEQQNYYNIPRPGETLLIFSSGWDRSTGYTLHRMSHHLDPGISLFDYEDREGYYVFDPTSEPYYYVFDERPVIEDITYTIYSDVKVQGWYKTYGNASNSTPSEATRYTIWNNNVSSVKSGNYWKTEIKLKAPRGEYSKALNIKFEASSSTVVTTNKRVYIGIYGGWARPPRAYFFKTGGGEYRPWADDALKMTVLPGSDGNIYYYDIPSGYEDAMVVFHDGKGNQTGDLQVHNGYITYDNNTTYWAAYPGHTSSSTTTTTSSVESVIFNGRTMPGNTGYFNSATRRWSSTPF